MEHLSEEERLCLNEAVEVKVLVPSMRRTDAMYSVGINAVTASSELMHNCFGHLLTMHRDKHGKPQYTNDTDEMADRAIDIFFLMKRHPKILSDPKKANKEVWDGVKLTEAMKLVGFATSQTLSGSAEYQKAHRRKVAAQKKIDREKAKLAMLQAPPLASIQAGRQTTAASSQRSRESSGSGSTLSPLTQSTGMQSPPPRNKRQATFNSPVPTPMNLQSPDSIMLSPDPMIIQSPEANISTPFVASTTSEDTLETPRPPTPPQLRGRPQRLDFNGDSSSSLDDLEEGFFFWPQPYPLGETGMPRSAILGSVQSTAACSSGATISSSESSQISSLSSATNAVLAPSKPVSIAAYTTTKKQRNTTEAAHYQRQLTEEKRSIHSELVKAGTVLWNGVRRDKNTLTAFSDAIKVADCLNSWVGLDIITGHEISSNVDKGIIGVSPPRRGRPSSMPDDEFIAFCEAVYSLSAIEQANTTDTRHTRKEIQSLVGEVLNAKREEDGLSPMQEVNFFRRIELKNSRKQDFALADPRESIRVRWLTYRCQKLNYDRWKDCVIELGFARLPTQDDPPDLHVVFLEDQAARILQLDEMSLSLDEVNSKPSGRQSKVPSANSFADSGQAAPKGADKATVIFGINFADEVFPPFIQFPTGATNEANYKLKVKMLKTFRQVPGQFGYGTTRYHDVAFGMNPKGGMNSKNFRTFILEHVCKLYPDAADVPGLRVIIKLDSGPGRFNPQLQAELRVLGFYVFPGLPNGTEIGQEMDQLYSYAKSLMYRNRKQLLRGRIKASGGESSALTLSDVGTIMFGGNVPLEDGTTLELADAFDLAFSQYHCRRAREKCGYCPHNRNALKDPKIRHELEAAADGDTETDTAQSLYEDVERINHEAVALLASKGYELAEDKLRRTLHRITAAQTEARTRQLTEPNTRERQDLIEKVSNAGQWFHVTNGGGPMNSNDAIIAWARKERRHIAADLEVKKKAYQRFGALEMEALSVLQSRPERNPQGTEELWKKTWKVSDFKTVIAWKQGPVPTEPLNHNFNVRKADLQKLYEDHYASINPQPGQVVWTEEMERTLEDANNGEVEDLIMDTELGRAIERDNEYLELRLRSVNIERREAILTAVMASLSAAERSKLLIAFNELDQVMLDGSFDDEEDEDL